MLGGEGLKGAAKAALVSAGTGGFLLGAAFGPSRALLRKLALPAPGNGPTTAERENGYFKLYFAGIDRDGNTLGATLSGDKDPGYGATSRMLGEAVVCLATRSPVRVRGGGGFSTPAAALGDRLVDRLLRHAGFSFAVEAADA